MVQCTIIGCNKCSDNKKKHGQDKVSFYSLQAVLEKGKQMRNVTTEWRCAWLKAISQADLVGKKGQL